jgi:hypothetical protein
MFDLFGAEKFEINRHGSDFAGQASSPEDGNNENLLGPRPPVTDYLGSHTLVFQDEESSNIHERARSPSIQAAASTDSHEQTVIHDHILSTVVNSLSVYSSDKENRAQGGKLPVPKLIFGHDQDIDVKEE